MTDPILALACFTGLFAFTCGWAGLAVLAGHNWPTTKTGEALVILDMILSDGIVTLLISFRRNWRDCPAARMLLYAGVSCGMACVILVWIVSIQP